jgi:starch-binding outer membrane protein, SusD/RagB family
MKSNIKFSIFGLLLLASACNLIDEKVYSFKSEGNFYQSDADVQLALNGAYDVFQNHGYFRYQYPQITMYLSPGIGGKGLDANPKHRELIAYEHNSTNNEIGNMWTEMYKQINACNDILEHLEDNTMVSENFGKTAKGEALFIRALDYFNLVRLFGAVPLRTKVVKNFDEVHVARTPVDEVYTQIIADLEMAYSLLPLEQADKGRATSGAAAALLAKIYLTRAGNTDGSPYWQNAKDWAEVVINSGVYQLEPDAANLWAIGAKNTDESIFEIQFVNGGEGNGTALPKLTQPSNSGTTALGTGWGTIRIEKLTYDDFVGKYPGDYRLDAYILDSAYTKTDGGVTKIYPKVSNANQGWTYINKYKDPDALENAEHGSNFIFLRYADVLLMFAEAENEINGPTAAAYDAVNQVLTRARNADGVPRNQPANWQQTLTKEEFRQAVLNERKFELIGEVHLWYDTIRKGVDYFLNELNRHNNNPNLTEFDITYNRGDDFYRTKVLQPLPQDEISTNQAIGVEDQNPGY